MYFNLQFIILCSYFLKKQIYLFVKFIFKTRKNQTKNPNDKINLLNKAIRFSYRLEQTAYNGINIAVTYYLSTIKFFKKKLKQVNKAILDTVSCLNSNA